MIFSPDSLKRKVHFIDEELVSIRRHLHTRPELSFHEEKTAEYLSGILVEWSIPHTKNIAGNGIVGVLYGQNTKKKCIALRADIDALPIIEKNDVSYKSLNTGVMHACGHDIHMTCLLGTLKILNDIREHWQGCVKFIFQPAEERLPGGAQRMIAEGVLENPRPEVIVAQHVFPELEVGKVGFRSGRYMASSDEINIFVNGKGGHAAIPLHFDNTVLAVAEIIVALEQSINNWSNADTPTILSFGKINAEGAHNIIPSAVSVHGTFRAFDEKWRRQVHAFIIATAKQIAVKHNTHCQVVINLGYPYVMNDPLLTEKLKQAAIEFLGKENIVDLDIRMTAEDFGYFSQVLPASFYRLGIANYTKGIVSNLHTDTFDVDEECIAVGTGLMIWNVLKLSNTK